VVMCVGLIFTTALSNLTVSMMREYIPARIRMMVETLIIAAYVIIVDIVLKAYLPDISRLSLGMIEVKVIVDIFRDKAG